MTVTRSVSPVQTSSMKPRKRPRLTAPRAPVSPPRKGPIKRRHVRYMPHQDTGEDEDDDPECRCVVWHHANTSPASALSFLPVTRIMHA